MSKQLLMLSGLCLFITACASTPDFNLTGVERKLTPNQVKAKPVQHKGKSVLWGGTILHGKNLKNKTRLEILAYPLDEDGWPDRERKPLGRFLIHQAGYLETASYAPGRLISVVGTVSSLEKGKVGETRYTYPVIEATQHHLWPKSGRKSESRVHFGIGVVFH